MTMLLASTVWKKLFIWVSQQTGSRDDADIIKNRDENVQSNPKMCVFAVEY